MTWELKKKRTLNQINFLLGFEPRTFKIDHRLPIASKQLINLSESNQSLILFNDEHVIFFHSLSWDNRIKFVQQIAQNNQKNNSRIFLIFSFNSKFQQIKHRDANEPVPGFEPEPKTRFFGKITNPEPEPKPRIGFLKTRNPNPNPK